MPKRPCNPECPAFTWQPAVGDSRPAYPRRVLVATRRTKTSGVGKNRVTIASFHQEGSFPYWNEGVFGCDGRHRLSPEGWYEQNNEGDPPTLILDAVTHWMPIPEADSRMVSKAMRSVDTYFKAKAGHPRGQA